jgi:hypothetical protein
MIWNRSSIVLAVASLGVAVVATTAVADSFERNFVGSVQLDYMGVPTESIGRKLGFDGATTELSLKLAQDFGPHVSSNVKLCVACHGLEVGMAFFDLRVADELDFRVGRFTPGFGEFPLRHDPANHATSDKPLPYDMGRMLRLREWNLGVLPSPWVDNGLEISGTHFFGSHTQIDYSVYAVSGPRAASENPIDFEYAQSRSGQTYYIDNNSRPAVGGRFAWSLTFDDLRMSIGASMMTGTYDENARLKFRIYGGHAVIRFKNITLRGEYLRRRTKMALGPDPATRFTYGPRSDGTYDPWFLKDGFYTELEMPIAWRIGAVLRWDGLHRVGNVLASNTVGVDGLSNDAGILRYTVGSTLRLRGALRLKLSGEFYDFRDFTNEIAVHLGVAGPF